MTTELDQRGTNRLGLVAVLCSICIALGGGVLGCRKTAVVRQAAEHGAAAPVATDGWIAMETLGPGKWVPIEGASDLEWDEQSHVMRIGAGNDLNGARWTGALPTVPYRVELEARRMSGSDFFCGLSFPARSQTECLTLIVGGWGGGLVGISSIDDLDASENSTPSLHEFDNERWYRIRVDVESNRLRAWIDDREVVDVETTGRKLSLRQGPIQACAPFGLATWQTRAEARAIRWQKLPDARNTQPAN